MGSKQQNRFIRLTTPLAPDALLIKQVAGVERLGRPFSYTLDLVSDNHDINFDTIVGQKVTIHVDNKDGSTRHFNGYVSTFEQCEPQQRKAVYRAVVVPWLWLLTRTSDCRIFSHTNRKQDAVEILKEIFDRFPFSNYNTQSLKGGYTKRPFCVQYRETAFNFVHRLMEEEGIYYYFKHEDGEHTMVLCDSSAAHVPAPDYATIRFNPDANTKVDTQSIWKWRRTQVVQPGHYEHTDYDFINPSADIRTHDDIARPHAASKLKYYDYPGRYYDTDLGTRLAQVRLEEFHAEHDVIHGEGDSRGLESGRTITLDQHPRADQNIKHLLTSVEYIFTQDVFESDSSVDSHPTIGVRPIGQHTAREMARRTGATVGPGALMAEHAARVGTTATSTGGTGGGTGGGTAAAASGSAVSPAATSTPAGASPAQTAPDQPRTPPCICRFTAINALTPFRPLRLTPRPLVQGPQTATVVGPPGEEIHTDKFGRIKVHFHWDLHTPRDAEHSSCWIRVSHAWAGPGWGAIYTPRIGQEVIVDFVEGDPDRPIVTGRVYNKERPVPYALPANKTVSTLKSHSSKGGSADNFNEIKFEDKKGEELMYVQAEKDRTMLVKNDNTETVKHDETISVEHDRAKRVDHDERTSIGNDRTETVGQNEQISIGSNRIEQVGSDESISIGANRTTTIGSNELINVGGNRLEQVGGNESVGIEGSRSHTVSMAAAETIGLAKALTIMGAYQVSVGAASNETIAGAKMEEIGAYKVELIGKHKRVEIGADLDQNVAGKQTYTSKELDITASTKITLTCGGSTIIMDATSITIQSTIVKINC